MALRAGTNIVGPNGEIILKDKDIPESWDKVFLDALVEGKAAYEVEDDSEEDEDGSE